MLQIWHRLQQILFNNIVGRIIVAVMASWIAFQGWLTFVHNPKVEQKVVTTINTKAKEKAKKAVKAREPAKKPGAADRLRRNSCRDC